MLGEAIQLERNDVDFRRRQITLRGGWSRRAREIPIGSDLYDILLKYHRRHHQEEAMNAPQFFLTKDGSQIKADTATKTFRRVRKKAGIARYDGARYQPRMQDLRQHADSVVMPIVFDSPSASPRFRLGSIGRTAVEVGIIRVVFSKLAMRPEGEKTDAGEVIRTSQDR